MNFTKILGMAPLLYHNHEHNNEVRLLEKERRRLLLDAKNNSLHSNLHVRLRIIR